MRLSWDRALRSPRQRRPGKVPPPEDPGPVRASDTRLAAAHGHALPCARRHGETGSHGKGDCEARTQGWRRLPGGRLIPPRRPAPRADRSCWKSLPARRPGARPQSTVSFSPGGRPQARPRSAAARPPQPAPQAVPPSATAAPSHHHPGRGQTKTLSWRRWPWPAVYRCFFS